MLVDLHVLLMDVGEADKLALAVAEAPVDGVCLVGFKALPDPGVVRRVAETGKAVFVGAELPLQKGHILVYPSDSDTGFAALLEGAPQGDEAASYYGKNGCAVVACHPYFKESTASMGDRIFQFRGMDAVMVVTGRSPNSANDLAVDALDVTGCPAAGGSAEANPTGRAATLFVRKLTTQAEFVAQLKGGDFWAVALGADDRWTDFPPAPAGERGGFSRGGDRRPPRRDGRSGGGDRRPPRRDGRSGGGDRRPPRRDGRSGGGNR